MLLRAAYDGDLLLLKKMARGLSSGEQGEAAVLEAVADEDGDRALHLAATEGRVEVCRYLVEDLLLNINQPNDAGSTPLYLSASFGRDAAARYFLDNGADPTVAGYLGSPLHGAAEHGHCGILELLLSRGVDVDIDFEYGTPLHVAAVCKQYGPMKILLEHHADPSNFCKMGGYTPLCMAIRPIPTESLECVKLLIKAGADVNFIDSIGVTYLTVTAGCGTPGIMKCLLDAGANPNILDGAMELDPSPDDCAILLANRSLCWLRWGNGKKALSDAEDCRMLRPHWPKACYRQGAAFMLLKDYEKACEAFADGLKLDPTSVDIAKALREAREAVKNCSEN